MAAADANGQAGTSEPSIENGSFAQGMYVTIWPKIERCHNYVSVLLAAQEQLQETVDQLIAGAFDLTHLITNGCTGCEELMANLFRLQG
jgi:hypothetical protein